MSTIETVAASVKDGAHSFKYIRKATGLSLSDDQFLELIKERMSNACGSPASGGRTPTATASSPAGRA